MKAQSWEKAIVGFKLDRWEQAWKLIHK